MIAFLGSEKGVANETVTRENANKSTDADGVVISAPNAGSDLMP
jgi:hypothetical protein